MDKEYGVWRLVREAPPEQWIELVKWLAYTAFGVVVPILFAWVGFLYNDQIVGLRQLTGHGELYLYSATFWIYALYSLDKSRLGPGFTRILPYLAVVLIGLGFSLLQGPRLETEVSTLRVNVAIIASWVLFLLSVVFCFMGNLIEQSKAMLTEKARLADSAELREETESALESEMRNLGGEQ